MKEEIEATLQPLVGQPLSDMWRYAAHQKFEFGEQRPRKNHKGQDVTWADWGLVVACDWRIIGPEGAIVSSEDFGPNNSRRDEKAHPFYETLGDAALVVEAIEAEEDGKVRFHLARGYLLEVSPDGEPDQEQWRFMPNDKQKQHFVISGTSIQR